MKMYVEEIGMTTKSDERLDTSDIKRQVRISEGSIQECMEQETDKYTIIKHNEIINTQNTKKEKKSHLFKRVDAQPNITDSTILLTHYVRHGTSSVK